MKLVIFHSFLYVYERFFIPRCAVCFPANRGLIAGFSDARRRLPRPGNSRSLRHGCHVQDSGSITNWSTKKRDFFPFWWSKSISLCQPAMFGGETNMNHGLNFKPPPRHSNVSHKHAHHIFGHLMTSISKNQNIYIYIYQNI